MKKHDIGKLLTNWLLPPVLGLWPLLFLFYVVEPLARYIVEGHGAGMLILIGWFATIWVASFASGILLRCLTSTKLIVLKAICANPSVWIFACIILDPSPPPPPSPSDTSVYSLHIQMVIGSFVLMFIGFIVAMVAQKIVARRNAPKQYYAAIFDRRLNICC